MSKTHFNSPIDMEIGPDGKLYVLEYGNGWFTKNIDASLSRIDYDPEKIETNKITGNASQFQKSVVDSAVLKIMGHQQKASDTSNIDKGRLLMETLDCKVCHKINDVSIGPSFTAVAKKYQRHTKSMTDQLSKKIIEGGSGVWGQTVMPAHPSLTQADAHLIIMYIYSLTVSSK